MTCQIKRSGRIRTVVSGEGDRAEEGGDIAFGMIICMKRI